MDERVSVVGPQSSVRVEEFGPLVLIFDPDQERSVNGMLGHPPRLFIRWFNEETDKFVEDPISFGAAKAIAPAIFLHMAARLKELREAAAPR